MASVKVLMVMEDVLLLASSPDLIIIQDHKRPIRKGAYDPQSISAPPRRKGSWRRGFSLLRAHRFINLYILSAIEREKTDSIAGVLVLSWRAVTCM